jgi:hypothetical protein
MIFHDLPQGQTQTECEEAFRKWYYQDGADWNASHVKPVFQAAWGIQAKRIRELEAIINKLKGLT